MDAKMMKTNTAIALLVLFLCSATAHAVVTFDWATVGNPDNAADRETGFGAVDSIYRISKYEVTNAQYTEFLNAVDPTGTNSLALYNLDMSNNSSGGINFDGLAASGSKYEIKFGRDNNPVGLVSFFDAMRFVNWLENGQGSGGTESGVYTIGSGLDEVRNPNASYFIPSEDEWYKAAYHKNDGVTGFYWDYPTGTDTEPYSDNPSSLNTPDDTNVANFFKDDFVDNGYDDGYAVTGPDGPDPSENWLTDVGAYSLATSPYGTFDQGGNVGEWTEGTGPGRGIRGGTSVDDSSFLHATYTEYWDPTLRIEDVFIGFRVASIPEPSLPVGDYNQNGVVDAADYVMWRNDPDAFGGDQGYIDWRANFGATGSGKSSGDAAIPEPITLWLLLMGILGLAFSRRSGEVAPPQRQLPPPLPRPIGASFTGVGNWQSAECPFCFG